jgi:hypothetical protein
LPDRVEIVAFSAQPIVPRQKRIQTTPYRFIRNASCF